MKNVFHALRWRWRVLSAPPIRAVYRSERGMERPAIAHPPVNPITVDSDAGMHQIEVGGRTYWVPEGTDIGDLGMIHAEVFEPEHAHFYEFGPCVVRPGDVVVDLGASEGMFVRFALERGASVIAVEPWEPMARCLRRTFAQEIDAGTVEIVEAGVSDHAGSANMLCDPAQPWGAALTEVAGDDPLRTAETAVRLMTLDSLVAGTRLGRCDFLKMDIEGAERAVFPGAHQTLRTWKPRISVAVYHYSDGYLIVRDHILRAGVPYTVAGKGLRHLAGVAFPLMLHAWPSELDTRGQA
jgi:FkbM family methyltransferase